MLRIATFNLENLDDKPDQSPSLQDRIPFLRSSLIRLNADIICFQEIHGQELPGHTSENPQRDLLALKSVLETTQYEDYDIKTTLTGNTPYDKRNLVIISRFPITEVNQVKHEYIDPLRYRKVTSNPAEEEAKNLSIERPILHIKTVSPEYGEINVINLHLKSRIASSIKGQLEGYEWQSAAGWAEGYFLSSIKRVAQALETRILIDSLFDNDINAKIVVCGDFNGEPGEVPVEAIAGRVENTNNPTLRERVLIACSRGIPESIRYTHLHHGHGNLLDHILMSQAMLPRFVSSQIFNENLHDESLPFTFDEKFPESDHAPFVAIFE